MHLIFRCVLLEQTALRLETFDWRHDVGVLMIAITEPDLDNTEIFLGGDSYTGHTVHKGRRTANRVAHDAVGQFRPRLGNILVEHLVGETSAVSVARILPRRTHTFPHHEQHAVLYQRWRQRLGDRDRFLDGGKSENGDVTFQTPVGVVRQMCPQCPLVGQSMKGFGCRCCFHCGCLLG